MLDRPQELDLETRLDVADLVQEHGAATGELEETAPILEGTGEGPLDVTEELTLDQGGTQGSQGQIREGMDPISAPWW